MPGDQCRRGRAFAAGQSRYSAGRRSNDDAGARHHDGADDNHSRADHDNAGSHDHNEGARIDAVVWKTAFARLRIKPEELAWVSAQAGQGLNELRAEISALLTT